MAQSATSESNLQRKVLNYLRKTYPDMFIWKASDRFIAGIPDIMCIYKGRALGIELKVGYNKPTALQAETHKQMRNAGATVVVAWDLDTVKQSVAEFRDA